MPRHVFLTADVEIAGGIVTLKVTDAEERDGAVPGSHEEIPGCNPAVLAAIGQRRSGSYKGVRFRPGVGSADFIAAEEIPLVLWTDWGRMAGFFRENFGDPQDYSHGFLGPVRTGGAGDTQWKIDTAAGTAASADLVLEAVKEFVELGVAEPLCDEAGKSVGLRGYGSPQFTGALAPWQGTIDATLAEEWRAMNATLRPTFEYKILPIRLPICDKLVGSDLPLIITANTGTKSVGALEFILTVERRFDGQSVAIVDIEATRKDGVITGFLNREVKLVTRKGGQPPMIFGLNPYGGISEQGLNFPLTRSVAPNVINTKSKAALHAAGIWYG